MSLIKHKLTQGGRKIWLKRNAKEYLKSKEKFRECVSMVRFGNFAR